MRHLLNLVKSPLFLPGFISFYIIYTAILIFRSSFVVDGTRFFTLFDNMMISMRYAKHLAGGHGLMWNIGGPPVEGFTNLLWTLYMTILHFIPLPLSKMGLLVQISGLNIMTVNLLLARQILLFFTRDNLVIFIGLLFTAFYFPLNNWGIVLGTEVGPLTLCVTAAAYLLVLSIKSHKPNPWLYLILGISTLLRMDAVIPAVLILAMNAFLVPVHRRSILIYGCGVLSAFLIAQETFRFFYYGDLLPNTYYLKLTGYPIFWRVARGLYILPGVMEWFILLPGILFTYATRQKYLAVLVILFLGQVAYSAYVGGDAWEFMGGTNRYMTIAVHKTLKDVTLLIDWFPEPTYLGIYYAESEGYFSKRGINIKLENVQGANRAVTAVATGQYPVSTASGSATVLSYNQYDNVVSLGVLYPEVASAVYGLRSSGISTPADLIGRKVGIYPGSINNQEFTSFLLATGVNPDSVQVVAISGSDVALLLEHKIDAAVNYRELSPVMLAIQIETQGLQDSVWVMRFSESVKLGYGLNVITSRQYLDKNAHLTKNVFESIVEGYKSACANEDHAVASFGTRFSELNRDYIRKSLKEVCTQLGQPIGSQSLQGWQQTISATADLGLISSERVRADALLP